MFTQGNLRVTNSIEFNKGQIEMSEDKKEEMKNQDEDKKQDLATVNLALIIAEKDDVMEKLSIALDEIEKLQKENANLKTLIVRDGKISLINWLIPRTTISKEVLSRMDYEDLLEHKKVLETAQMPVFKSGTPFNYTKKSSPREKLDSLHDDYMAKIRGGNK